MKLSQPIMILVEDHLQSVAETIYESPRLIDETRDLLVQTFADDILPLVLASLTEQFADAVKALTLKPPYDPSDPTNAETRRTSDTFNAGITAAVRTILEAGKP